MGIETKSEVMDDERFSDQARLTIQGSPKQALQLESHAIGTEHLLLSLLIEGDGAARKTLEMLAISPESIRRHVLAVAVARPRPVRTLALTKSPDGHIPFTPEALKVIEHASREARKLGHRYLGAEHMLLALIRERNGLAGRVLADLGADLDTARGFVVGLIEHDGVPAGIPPEWAHPEPRQRAGGMSRWRRKRSQ
jgi:ATP-dependent Clp protease ATP-binding subunit ClpC